MDEHISVCICTYRRPRYLRKLLQSLCSQVTRNAFTYSVVVVDNDSSCSAEATVDLFKENAPFPSSYLCEPVKNISMARNKAIANSTGSYIAFIDDDEFASEEWLFNLYSTLKTYEADGVLGPVISYFEGAPPKWIKSSRILARDSFETGTRLSDSRYTRTGNVLFSRNLFDASTRFDPVYGRSGGEDIQLFKQLIGLGKKFVWCNEAPVYEHVPPDRWTRRYHVKRALLRGSVCGSREGFSPHRLLKSISAFLIYSAFLPFSFMAGQGCFMKYFIKNCNHLGFLLSFCGIRLLTEKV